MNEPNEPNEPKECTCPSTDADWIICGECDEPCFCEECHVCAECGTENHPDAAD